MKVVVCGAGVAGLATAQAFRARGIDVVVLDRQRAVPVVPKGELLQPGSLRVLATWGLLDALEHRGGVRIPRLVIRDRAGAASLAMDYDQLDADHRWLLSHRHEVILDVLSHGVDVRRGVTVRGREDVGADLVVAADGLSSRLRKQAGIGGRPVAYPHRLLTVDLAGSSANEVTAHASPRGLRLRYPLPDGRTRLYVQVRRTEFDADELLAEMPSLTPLANELRTAQRTVLPVWRFRAERLCAPGLALVGEAAHSVHPMAAQGMNTAIADAEELAAQVAEHGPTEKALLAYERARAPWLDHLATVSHNAARMLTTTSGPQRALGRRMMRGTAANPRLVRITAHNMAGLHLRPLTFVDRLYQLGVLR